MRANLAVDVVVVKELRYFPFIMNLRVRPLLQSLFISPQTRAQRRLDLPKVPQQTYSSLSISL